MKYWIHNSSMIKNYLVVTLRNLFRNKVYSFINIFGLATGISCSLLILLWVFDEISFDRFHPKLNTLYQVWINAEFDGKINSWTSVPLPLYEGLKTEDARLIRTAVTDWSGDHLLTVGENRINKVGYYASEEFLEMFEFPMISGSPRQSLEQPNSIVITESVARALFGENDAMGQVIRLDNQDELQVTGILRDVPTNSSFQFDCLIPWKLNETRDWVKRNKDNWGNYSFQVFAELSDPAHQSAVESRIHDLLLRHGEVEVKRELFLYPLERWRLHRRFENGVESGGQNEFVQLFSSIAVFILVIACINFMNLATARSERRAREVGIRKTVGGRRRELVFQFIGESILITTLAFGIAVLLTELALPYYNDLVEKKLSLDYASLQFWEFAVGLILFTGIISGSYPALYLSSFQPTQALKGKITIGKGGTTPRKVLVTMQFIVSVLLVISMLVIYRQIQHVKNRDIGYSQEGLITVEYTREIEKQFKAIKNELLQSGVVSAVAKSNSPITAIWSNNFLGWPGKPEDRKVMFSTIACEYDYSKTMGIRMLEGRDFSEEISSDSTGIIVNKAALDLMQLKDPIGQQLELWGKKKTLIGIIDNVIMESPDNVVRPLFMVFDPNWSSSVTIRLEKTRDIQSSLKTVEDIFRKYNPAYPFDYDFADVEFRKKFKSVTMTGQLAALFATLAILITGLGLFGLAAFTAEQRTKEIGIRKVMGASVRGLVIHMSQDFSRLVLIALAIATPLAWWAMNAFLNRYTYRTDVPWWIFPVTGAIALLFAIGIVATQALRAARANPVNSLRND
ncbi:MAG TPA: ABC transporter permease [Cyclobacteriaceae bacterium]|nr:ABC transporter permease [Cyclobacteriaceae bacterium]